VAGPNSWDPLKDPATAGVLVTISVGLGVALGVLVTDGVADGVLDDPPTDMTPFPFP
jgi:hypothetical protein